MPTSMDTYAPFDTGAGSAVTESGWRKFMRNLAVAGVIPGVTNELSVYGDATGMLVKVRTGEAWIRGHWGEITAEKSLTIATADGTNPRKDRVIARADFVDNVVELDVLTGTPAGSPSAPATTQDANQWEVSLAIVDVPALDTSIGAAQVTDDRAYTTARGGVAVVATSTHLATIESPFTGQLALSRGDNLIYAYNSGIWTPVAALGGSTSATRHNARYYQSADTSMATALTDVAFPTAAYASSDVSPNGSSNQFTINRAGVWTAYAGIRLAGGTVTGVGERFALISDGTTSYAMDARFVGHGTYTHLTLSTGPIWLAAGTVMRVRFSHQSTGAINTDTSSGQTTFFALMWHRA